MSYSFFHSLIHLLSVAFLFPFFLQGIVLDSEHAEYHGKQITLSGNVTVEHELGTLSANSVELHPQMVESKPHFYNLNLLGDVHIRFADGGQIACEKAEVDYQTKAGKFHGNQEQEYVIYTEKSCEKIGALPPLTVSSRHMTIQIDNGEQAPAISHHCLNHIQADDDVSIHYNDFIITAPHASYQRSSGNNESKEKTLPGLIVLKTEDVDEKTCEVSNSNGDRILSDYINMDTVKRKIHFANPKGVLHRKTAQSESEAPLSFSCSTLVWDDAKGILTLSDRVAVSQKGLGVLTTDEKIQFVQHNCEGSRQLHLVEGVGKTIFAYKPKENELSHTVTCYGKILIDHQLHQTSMSSPIKDNGEVVEGQQIILQDELGDIYADKVIINYRMEEGSFIASKIILEGHVHILNRGAIDPEKTKAFLEYALADLVEYNPEDKEVSLSSTSPRRVLFFDRINNLQVSAPALKIKRDQTSNKDSIQGIGDVRFSFIKRELEEIEKHFHLLMNKESKEEHGK